MGKGTPAEERYLIYLAKAEEARQKALTAKDPLARYSWEQLAVSWQQLAQQVKRNTNF
jgi:hypothetical protein